MVGVNTSYRNKILVLNSIKKFKYLSQKVLYSLEPIIKLNHLKKNKNQSYLSTFPF